MSALPAQSTTVYAPDTSPQGTEGLALLISAQNSALSVLVERVGRTSGDRRLALLRQLAVVNRRLDDLRFAYGTALRRNA